MTLELLIIPIAYLMGSISSAILICKVFGLPDPRGIGSGNPGATNVLRTGNKFAAGLTLFGDIFKGVLPVLIAHALDVNDAILAATAAAAFLGHLFPLYFNFKGGKGVATALGVMTAMSWPVGLLCLATWIITALLTRISSLSALVASSLAPAYLFWLSDSPWLAVGGSVMAILILIRHKKNIHNLLNGTEPKIGEGKKAKAEAEQQN